MLRDDTSRGHAGEPTVRFARRLVQLYAGLVLYGASAGLILLAGLGADPWDVFHQGLSRRVGLGTGAWVCIVGALVLLLWIPLKQKPGLGTVSNVIVIGVVLDLVLALFAPAEGPLARGGLLVAGVVLNGVATGLYIGARLGPGPRDGLMTGLAARGHSLRVVRTGIELTVLAAGALLGGTVGIGTVAYAVAIGPLAHVFVPLFALPQNVNTGRVGGAGRTPPFGSVPRLPHYGDAKAESAPAGSVRPAAPPSRG
jgi:uncharacterized membrane protein YczE